MFDMLPKRVIDSFKDDLVNQSKPVRSQLRLTRNIWIKSSKGNKKGRGIKQVLMQSFLDVDTMDKMSKSYEDSTHAYN